MWIEPVHSRSLLFGSRRERILGAQRAEYVRFELIRIYCLGLRLHRSAFWSCIRSRHSDPPGHSPWARTLRSLPNVQRGRGLVKSSEPSGIPPRISQAWGDSNKPIQKENAWKAFRTHGRPGRLPPLRGGSCSPKTPRVHKDSLQAKGLCFTLSAKWI